MFLYLKYAVEACVAGDGHVVDAYTSEQLLALLVLYVEVGEAVQYFRVAPPVPLEEYLVVPEYAAHAVHRYFAVLQYVQIVVPELVFDEESHHRPYHSQEPDGVNRSVERQIAYHVGAIVVLSHLISGWREERQQYLIFRVIAAQTLYQRASLFELSKRCGVKPHIAVRGVHLLLEHVERPAFALPHLFYFLVEQACHGHAQQVKIYSYVIHFIFMVQSLE